MNRPDRTRSPPEPPRVVRLKPSSYQPSKAELDESSQFDASPEEVARGVVRPVIIRRDAD